jgi:hypothetical protein
MNLTLNRQSVWQDCVEYRIGFQVVRGQVLDDGEPIGLYLVALHGHDPSGRLAHLAIAILNRTPTPSSPNAAAMTIRATAKEYTFAVEDWSVSPWKDEKYLGEMLSRESLLANPSRDLFFHIGDHVVGVLPEIGEYFA